MANSSLRNPIILALAVRPALATFGAYTDMNRDDFYSDLMRFGLILIDTVLFAWLVREVYLLKDATAPQADGFEVKD